MYIYNRYTYMYIYIYIYIHIYIHIHIVIYVYIGGVYCSVFFNLCFSIYIYTLVYVCMYLCYICTYLYIYIYIYSSMSKRTAHTLGPIVGSLPTHPGARRFTPTLSGANPCEERVESVDKLSGPSSQRIFPIEQAPVPSLLFGRYSPAEDHPLPLQRTIQGNSE
jgi:hypothetical protein